MKLIKTPKYLSLPNDPTRYEIIAITATPGGDATNEYAVFSALVLQDGKSVTFDVGYGCSFYFEDAPVEVPTVESGKRSIPETLRLHALWVEDLPGGARADLQGAALTCADLKGANLRGADLRWADLRGADLRGADLAGAGLQSADLQDADLTGADLQDADLTGADLSGSDLRCANLRGANLSWAHLKRANLFWACLQGANLRRANLRGANIFGADLEGADITGAYGLDTISDRK